MKYHYLAQYLASSQHKITISVVGCGGTGSHVLTNLAAMNHALVTLGRQPLHVQAYDDDIIEEHNVGRQMFSPSDIGLNKSDVLIERINRYFGLQWESIPARFGTGMTSVNARGTNILISCVDTVKSRKDIMKYIADENKKHQYRHDGLLLYWMDIGNSVQTGQIILGTVWKFTQPSKDAVERLPCWTDEYKNVRDKKEEPSCSLAESLGKQDLFINKIMASYATNMLWQFMKNYRINYRGIYVNLESMKTQPILL